MPPQGRYEEYSKKEISFIETELKDWFLTRRFGMERNMAVKQALDGSNFSGLSNANAAVDPAQKVLWGDLVHNKPELDDCLSTNGKQMKSDMYMKMFKDSTDLDHPCRLPGTGYLRCLQDNFKDMSKTRSMKCASFFGEFDACRQAMVAQQTQAVENALVKQDIADRRAKALFERRSILLDTQEH